MVELCVLSDECGVLADELEAELRRRYGEVHRWTSLLNSYQHRPPSRMVAGGTLILVGVEDRYRFGPTIGFTVLTYRTALEALEALKADTLAPA